MQMSLFTDYSALFNAAPVLEILKSFDILALHKFDYYIIIKYMTGLMLILRVVVRDYLYGTLLYLRHLHFQTNLHFALPGLRQLIIIIMARRQLRSVATTLHDDRDPVPSSTPV